MKNKKDKSRAESKNIKKIVNPKRIKSLGITKDLSEDVEHLDGQTIVGGKDTDPTVATHWPTNNNI